MRILALNFTEKGVGTYLRAFYFCRELARAEHKVTLATVSALLVSALRCPTSAIGSANSASRTARAMDTVDGRAGRGNCFLPGRAGVLELGRTRELETSTTSGFGFVYQLNVSWLVYFTQRRKNYAFYSDWCDWFGGSSNWLRLEDCAPHRFVL